jgi:aryl-alcohol dehydrogenase-like predicted oxidoreductase
MKYRPLGTGGPMVSAIGLGCMSFGGAFGPTTKEASFRCLDAAYDHGLTFLDTANIYGMGLSEATLGEWPGLHKSNISIATKASIINGPPRQFDNSENHLRTELESSLKRLGVDHVDLFYIHRREETRPIEEVVLTMTRLIDDGLIGGYGLSEISPGTLRRAHAVYPCRAVQNEYSLWSRQPELGLIQTCAELGVAFVPFSPLGRGVFGREIIDPATLPGTDFRLQIPRFQDPDWSLNLTRLNAFRSFAQDAGMTPSALALAWILDQGPHLIPIPGTRSADHLSDWITAADTPLSAELRAGLAKVLPAGWAYGDRYNLTQASTVERYC